MKRAYARASCEYQTSTGLTAARAPTIRPVRRDTSSLPTAIATGTVSVPRSAERERSAASPVPNSLDQHHASR
jgi:hypothetical protein